jgi:hypothetical protein
MSDIRDSYREDYKNNRNAFKEAFAIDEREGKNYVLFTPRPQKPAFGREAAAVGSVCYVATYLNFEPSIGGANPEPDWSFDLYNRLHLAAVYTEIGETIVSSEDAEVRIFDDDNADDDGDTLQKRMQILTGHQLFLDPGDDIEGAKVFKPYYAHMESEFNAWKVSLFGGDEAAARAIDRDNLNTWWKNDIAGSELWNTVGTPPVLAKFVPKSVHFMVPEKVQGRGLSSLFEATLTKQMSFRGYGGWYLPGPAARGPEILGTAVGGDFTVTPQFENVWTDLPVTKTTAEGFDWNLRLKIAAGTISEIGYILMRVTKPSGDVEDFRTRVEEADWTDPYFTTGVLVELEEGINVIDGYIVDEGEQVGVGSSTFELVDVGTLPGPTVFVECDFAPGVPKSGATVFLYTNNGTGEVLFDTQVTGASGIITWTTVPGDTTTVRLEGSADCGTTNTGPLGTWEPATITLQLAGV